MHDLTEPTGLATSRTAPGDRIDQESVEFVRPATGFDV
jgi:hypothetical protein